MKKLVLFAVLLSALPLGMMAQDDLYFTPSKSKSEAKAPETDYDDSPAYYSGSNRNVDEYNRRGKLSSYYQKIGSDSLGNDIIQFHAGNGQYPDSLVLDTIYPGSQQYYAYGGDDSDDNFAYSRRMNRFDNDYGWYDPYFYSDLSWDYPYYYGGWGPYWRVGWGWYDPWYAGWGWGGYYGWYDPWYYGGYWGYRPGYAYWGWGPGYGYSWYGGHTGTRNHWDHSGRANIGEGGYGRGNFGGYRGGSTASARGSYGRNSERSGGNYRTFGGRRPFGDSRSTSSTWGNTTRQSMSNSVNNDFGGNRSFGNSNSFGGNRSFGSSNSFGGSRSFGGSSFGGGSHGGSFGGGGRVGGGGGGHFGGRR